MQSNMICFYSQLYWDNWHIMLSKLKAQSVMIWQYDLSFPPIQQFFFIGSFLSLPSCHYSLSLHHFLDFSVHPLPVYYKLMFSLQLVYISPRLIFVHQSYLLALNFTTVIIQTLDTFDGGSFLKFKVPSFLLEEKFKTVYYRKTLKTQRYSNGKVWFPVIMRQIFSFPR